MSSVFYRINKLVLAEYQYLEGSVTHNTDIEKYKKITNKHVNDITVISDEGSVTKNVSDVTVVDIGGQGKMALLDKDTAYYYPNSDPDIVVTDISIFPSINVEYDKVRIHILSGYNFDELEGFIASVYMRSGDNKQIRLSNIAYLKSSNFLLKLNSSPIKISGDMFDKYVEFEIPSPEYMLDDQEANPGSDAILCYYFTNGQYFNTERNAYFEFREIESILYENGFVFLNTGEVTRFSFSTHDKFDVLTASIEEKESYFEYSAKWDGNTIEDFIFSLNSLAGNNYCILHDIEVIEQIGESFIPSYNISTIQRESYDRVFKFRPILEYASSATSFSISYTVRLYNQVDGKSIVKTSYITSMNVNKYGERMVPITISGATPVKIYNQIVRKNNEIIDSLSNILTNVMTVSYINTYGIELSESTPTVLINPFDNIISISLIKENTALSLSSISDHYMVFIRNDNTELKIPEFKNAQYNKNNGELVFKLLKQQAKEIIQYANKAFYITSRNPDGIETVIYKGQFTI